MPGGILECQFELQIQNLEILELTLDQMRGTRMGLNPCRCDEKQMS